MTFDSTDIDMQTELEKWIDHKGLSQVLNAISVICGEKAEHLRSNWQDTVTAKSWDKDANKIGKLANSVES